MFKIVDVPEDCGCSRLWMFVKIVDVQDCGCSEDWKCTWRLWIFVKIVDVREDCECS